MYNYNSNWYEKDDISKLLNTSPEKIIVFDTETTGLNPYGNDEILQLAIINGNGGELFSSYIKPDLRKTWAKAAEVNGITPRMVKDSPHFEDVEEQVQEIFNNADLIVGYNVEFDLRFIEASGIKLKKKVNIFDVMREYAVVRGVQDNYYGDYKWCKLEQCARAYKYKFNAHDALEDAKATLHCYKSLLSDERYTDIIAENKREKERVLAEIAHKEQVRIENEKRIAEAKAREEELRIAEEKRKEEERQRKEKKKKEILTKADKPMNVLKIILMVLGILWIVVITFAGLSAKVGIGFTIFFDLPGVVAIIIALKIKQIREKNRNSNS